MWQQVGRRPSALPGWGAGAPSIRPRVDAKGPSLLVTGWGRRLAGQREELGVEKRPMALRYDPFPLILTQGDEATQLACLVVLGLADLPQAQDCLLQLVTRQRADGAHPSQLNPERWGMRETVRTTLLLLQAELPRTATNVADAVTLILERQNADGGWSENPALALPGEQTWVTGQRSITWLTADVVDLLRKVGQGESPACRRALAWLRATQTPDGGWPSVAWDVGGEGEARVDPDSTAQIAFLMGDIYGHEDVAYRKGEKLFERHLDRCARDAERGYWIRLRDGQKERLDVYHLTHLLLSWLLDPPRRFRAGYDVSDPRVRRMMEALLELQREDGGWRPFFAEDSSPVYTALAVRVLVLSGMLDRAALAERVADSPR